MAALMWTVWVVGTILSLVTIYALLRVLYSEDSDGEQRTEQSTETATEIEAEHR